MTSHTPGPWHVIRKGYEMRGKYANCHGIAPEAGPAFAYINGGREDVQDANARLIAAAPDMLAALQNLAAAAEEMRGKLEQCGYITPNGYFNQAYLAIAKAEGRDNKHPKKE